MTEQKATNQTVQMLVNELNRQQNSPESARRERRVKPKSDEGCYQYPEDRKVF